MAILVYLWLLVSRFYFLVSPLSSFPEESYYFVDQDIPSFVEKMPEFPGGEIAMNKFLLKEVVFTKSDMDERIQTTFHIELVINALGKVTAPVINRKKPGNLTKAEQAVLRAVLKMPRWKPGEHAGKKVAVKTFIPLIAEIRD